MFSRLLCFAWAKVSLAAGAGAFGLLLAVEKLAPPAPAKSPRGLDAVEGEGLALAREGDGGLRVLAPTVLEIARVTTREAAPAPPQPWDLVAAGGELQAPPPSAFRVLVEGKATAVSGVGYRQRPLYAPLGARDLRLEHRLFLELALPVHDGQTVQVKCGEGNLWPPEAPLTATMAPLRRSPVLHVNQQGYLPAGPKQAMAGYYLGNMGELALAPGPFRILEAATGRTAFTGRLRRRPDTGFGGSPVPYQNVLEADFSTLQTPGSYLLAVPGLGVSAPFRIHEGVAMDFTRAYALGLLHQRCGAENALPFTRFTHAACHLAPAQIPLPEEAFASAWKTIAAAAEKGPDPRHTAPRLKHAEDQLYPFVHRGAVDVSGGHHDAGDYSKYTINSALFIHTLLFAVDALPGVAALDNLGLPESGDGRSDLLQMAKWEADFLAKMQDDDGGFYFLVYPQARSYESDVLPDAGDRQIVWPKNTSATAAAVAALAQASSSPQMRREFPEAAAAYGEKARRGWQFLLRALAEHGADGAYQKLTHYGNEFRHDDELAWAACEIYLAMGDAEAHRRLREGYDPADRRTRRWTWWRLYEGYGCAARSYAFARRTGRNPAEPQDARLLAQCEAEIVEAGEDARRRTSASAYGTAFEAESKRTRAAGWYFSLDRAFEMAVAHALEPSPAYVEAMLSNLNYEGGTNPLNLSFVTGMGSRRQREIVHQYAQNDRRTLPPSGLPLGNLQSGFGWIGRYGRELGAACFPLDGDKAAPYPLYDRWGDSFNTTTEFVIVNQARALATAASLAATTPPAGQPWRSAPAEIVPVTSMPQAQHPLTVSLHAREVDLSGASIVWEVQGEEPALDGAEHLFTPRRGGPHWVEAEAQWPDGRRVFAAGTVTVSP